MDFLLRNLLTRPPFSYLYAISPPHKKRDRPMLVLALGLSRCGTESLKFALEELGYQGVYHGFETTGSHAVGWCRLLDLKYSGKGSEIKKEDFDQIIGDYEAVTDAPANMLAEEIMRAYPDAKVILNRRSDVSAWERSFQETLIKVVRDTLWLKVLAWFSADYFWLRQFLLRYVYEFFHGDFEKHGREVYEEHYRNLETILGGPKSGKYLSWTVEDGWKPLCQFLGKEIPATAFPSGNAPDAFNATMTRRRKKHIQTVKWNMLILFGSLLVIGLAIGASQGWYPKAG